MNELLQQIEDLGLKRCTIIGSETKYREGFGYYTHLAPKDGDFDPYVSPVFGETEYESLKEAIAEWQSIARYAEIEECRCYSVPSHADALLEAIANS